MIVIKDKKECMGCHGCYNACPKKAINMVNDEYGFKYPKVDYEKCIDCNLCEKVCPIKNQVKKDFTPIAYAAYNKDESIRLKSSSGGIFYLLAREIIDKNGVVFGARFDKNFNLYHAYTDKEKELVNFMGSKYVQSEIGNSYRKVKEFLQLGRYVLFTGTPCQIEGLKNYLGNDYPNLITQDIVCHGVPSPLVLNKYLKEFSKEIKSIKFRDKNTGWKEYSISINANDNSYIKKHYDDVYMKLFLNNITLRDSCYDCKFKDKTKASDITLGDFWGIEDIDKSMNNDLGTSLVVINSNKGKRIFKAISSNVVYKEVNLNEAIKYNTSYIKSSKKNMNREKFFRDIDKYTCENLSKKYIIKSSKLKAFIKKVVRKIKRYE